MKTAAPHRLLGVLGPLFAQALFWTSLTIAFAALLKLAGPQSWSNALRFSALNWMPWAVLAPLVFWFSGRFPLERGHLWRSIPAHVLGTATCVGLTLGVSAYFTLLQPPPPRPEDRPEWLDRSSADGPSSSRTVVPRDDTRRPDLARTERLERERFPRAEPFGRRGGPFWWPFLGATLQRANFNAAVYLIVAIAAHALSFYRRAQDRERHAAALTAGLNRAKLDALRLQLQPHFLFNTLNAISTLVHRDATAADELIGDLSELLRLSLQTSDHEVPLSRELELLDRYMAIEQTRLGDRLRIVRRIDPQLGNAFVPTFLLQPLVENAIRHGIEPRLAPGTVTVRAHREGDRLHLAVADDGVGLGANVSSGRRGIGITNTEARLSTLYGPAASLVIDSPAAGGVEVRITLPFSTTPRLAATAPASNPARPVTGPLTPTPAQ